MNYINGYERYLGEPNTIHPNARIYYKYFNIDTNNSFTNRLIRVYIPLPYKTP